MMEWDEFLRQREDFIGRDLLTDEDTGFCRGPITYLVGQQKALKIHIAWIAYSNDQDLWWLTDHPQVLWCSMDFAKVERKGDRLDIEVKFLGTFSILPEGDKLDKKKTILLDEDE